jgi:hypothetical protein
MKTPLSTIEVTDLERRALASNLGTNEEKAGRETIRYALELLIARGLRDAVEEYLNPRPASKPSPIALHTHGERWSEETQDLYERRLADLSNNSNLEGFKP